MYIPLRDRAGDLLTLGHLLLRDAALPRVSLTGLCSML
jgi:hypothetical protein